MGWSGGGGYKGGTGGSNGSHGEAGNSHLTSQKGGNGTGPALSPALLALNVTAGRGGKSCEEERCWGGGGGGVMVQSRAPHTNHAHASQGWGAGGGGNFTKHGQPGVVLIWRSDLAFKS